MFGDGEDDRLFGNAGEDTMTGGGQTDLCDGGVPKPDTPARHDLWIVCSTHRSALAGP